MKKISYLPLLLLAAVSTALFLPALGHHFLINWDDNQYLVGNPAAHGLAIENIKAAFTTNFVGNYAPLHIISYMVDYEVWGLRASGFILTNILLHAANGIFFYLLLKRIAGEKVWAFFASLIFLAHPVQVESVVWISQRKNVLAMLFFLISFYLYVLYKEKEMQPRIGLYLASLASFALSLLSKSVAVVAPVAFLLYDICYLNNRSIRSLLADKVPFLLIAGLFGIVAVQSHSAQLQGGVTSYHGGSFFATVLTMLPVLVRYLTKVFWPADLSAYYDLPIKTSVDFEVAGAALIVALLFLVGIVTYRRKREMFFWFVTFFLFLLPVSQIIPIVTLMNDRYLYFPMLGATVFLGMALFRDVGWVELRALWKYIPAVSFSILAVAACSAATLHRIPVWKNSFTLWSDAIKKSPDVALTHDCFGEGLLEQGQIEKAIKEFETALKLEPNLPPENLSPGLRRTVANTRNNLGAAYGLKGMTDEAIEEFTLAIRLDPDFDRAYFNLGNALMHKGLTGQALRSFETAVRLNPQNPQFVTNLRHTKELIRTGGFTNSRGKAD